MAPYPTKAEIRVMFAPLANADYKEFFSHVADNVDWTIMGHHPIAGHYTTRDAFLHASQRLGAIMQEPMKLVLENIVGGDHEDQAVVELKTVAVCKNGKPDSFCTGEMLRYM